MLIIPGSCTPSTRHTPSQFFLEIVSTFQSATRALLWSGEECQARRSRMRNRYGKTESDLHIRVTGCLPAGLYRFTIRLLPIIFDQHRRSSPIGRVAFSRPIKVSIDDRQKTGVVHPILYLPIIFDVRHHKYCPPESGHSGIRKSIWSSPNRSRGAVLTRSVDMRK